MRISKLIEKLEKAKTEHGDLVVTQHQWNDPKCPHRTQGVEVREVKANYHRGATPETFVFTERLRNGGYGGGPMFTDKHQKKMEGRSTIKVLHIYYDRA